MLTEGLEADFGFHLTSDLRETPPAEIPVVIPGRSAKCGYRTGLTRPEQIFDLKSHRPRDRFALIGATFSQASTSFMVLLIEISRSCAGKWLYNTVFPT